MKKLDNVELVNHYLELISGQLDTYANSIDDDMPDQWDELVNIVSEMLTEIEER